MADKANRYDDNADGKYYIDEECTACGVCQDEAPDNIKMTDDESHAIVFKQPDGDEEIEAMQSAIDGCPSEAIGDDGE